MNKAVAPPKAGCSKLLTLSHREKKLKNETLKYRPTLFGTVCKVARLAALGAGLVALASCGGGGGSNPSPGGVLNFSGTVAVGAALQNVVVSVSCKDGATGRSSPTDSAGQYALSIRASLPCTFQAIEPVTGFVFRSLTDVDGTVNISPLSEMVFVFANGDTARLVEAKAKLSSLMSGIGSNLEGDPLRTPFAANERGLDKNILDLVKVSSVSSGVISNPYAGLGTLKQALTDGTCLVAPGTGTTFDPTGKPVIPMTLCPKLVVLARFNAVFSPADAALASVLFDKILTEADSTAWLLVKQAWPGGADQKVAIAIEAAQRATVYGIGLLIEQMDSATLSRLIANDLGLTTAKGIAAKMKEVALGNLRSPSSINPFEFVTSVAINSAVGYVLDNLTEGIVGYSMDANGVQQSVAGLTFGAIAYPTEVLFSSALACAITPPVCGVTVGVAIVGNTTKWIYKDVATVLEILKVQSDTRQSAVASAVGLRLQDDITNFDNVKALGLVSWAKNGMTIDAKAILESRYNNWVASTNHAIVEGETGAICSGFVRDVLCTDSLSFDDRNWFKNSHVDRLSRVKNRLLAKIEYCVVAKRREGEVGVSKCLNILNVNSAAPVSCEAGRVLIGGECIDSPITPTPGSTVIPVGAFESVTTPLAISNSITGSIRVTDPGDQVINLRVHVGRALNGSDCQIDIGDYNVLQEPGVKAFSGCASMTATAGNLFLKLEARDSKGLQAEVVRTVVVVAAGPITTPGVIPVPPPTTTIAIPATAFVRGTNVALSANGFGADAVMNAPPYGSAPNAAEWDIVVPTAGRYELFANYAAALSRPVTISFGGVVKFTNALSAVTGGWFPANRQSISQGFVDLPAGAMVMRVARGDVFAHIQGFTLVPVARP